MPDYIPTKDDDFHTWQANFLQQLSPIGTRVGIPTEKLTGLQDLQGEWVDNWLASSAPATRTKVTIDAKNAARVAYKADIRAIVRQYLINNDAVTLADRDTLGIPVHKTTRTPVPVPTGWPEFWVDTGTQRHLFIHFHEHGKKSSAKGFGIHGAEGLYGISDTSTPLKLEQLTKSVFDTRTPLELVFGDVERGKFLSIAMRWENTRGQKGPWSEILTVVIP